jgi:CRISPR-associated protein Cmr1
LDQKRFKEALKNGKSQQKALSEQICPACQLFGCTGWARKFILRIEPEKSCSYAPFFIVKLPRSRNPYFLGYHDRSGSEYEKNGGLIGEYRLTFFIDDEFHIKLIHLLLKLATNWGIGSGIQKGFGICYMESDSNFSVMKIPVVSEKMTEKQNSFLPRFDQFFFYRIPINDTYIDGIKDAMKSSLYKIMRDLRNKKTVNFDLSTLSYIPSAPLVRKSVRHLFSDNDVLRHFIMGFASMNKQPKPIHLKCWTHSVEKMENDEFYCNNCKEKVVETDILEKTGSKIFVSHLYNKNVFTCNSSSSWEMKVWGWIPEIPEKIGKTREEIKQLLQSNFKNEQFWKGVFSTKENPVNIGSIWECWDPTLDDLVDARSEIYG